jgi:hypothetical protein
MRSSSRVTGTAVFNPRLSASSAVHHLSVARHPEVRRAAEFAATLRAKQSRTIFVEKIFDDFKKR